MRGGKSPGSGTASPSRLTHLRRNSDICHHSPNPRLRRTEDMDALLQELREFDALRDQKNQTKPDHVELRKITRCAPAYASGDVYQDLPQSIQSALHASGITALYEHQADAIRHAVAGENVVLESPTASGKTLCFLIPMVMSLLEEPQSHGLLLYPMKALSNDQRRQIRGFVKHLGNRGRDLSPWMFDGDTPTEHRRWLKQDPPAMLLTNPEMLHLSFLGWSEQWEERLLRRLRFIVVDEIHEYRGYFGTNMSLLLRRLLLKLKRLGASPQLFLASATCANCLEHAERLTGAPFHCVSAADRMSPCRHLAFIDTGIRDYQFRQIYQLRIARAALACLSRGYATIAFCPSRAFAEQVFKRARKDAADLGLDPTAIAPYRSGYTAEERRDIEVGLRDGRYQVVFCTNALELGIDK